AIVINSVRTFYKFVWQYILTLLFISGDETLLNQPVRQYARQLQDLHPSLLKHEYASVPLAQSVDDVVKKLLMLELANHSEKLCLKEEQLIAKVRRDENDRSSTEVNVGILTARIRNFQEHLHKHPKDKANKRWMLMAIDSRKKKLKFLRRTRYDSFEKVCQELGITYTFPPEYYRWITRRWLAKKAFCNKVTFSAQPKCPSGFFFFFRFQGLHFNCCLHSIFFLSGLSRSPETKSRAERETESSRS
uniref:Small ribosomal subunit protein uS15m n=1 Tax=Sinocyclocheilus grahami TaxID=75366 RepID=A0A672PRU5_SINGR